MRIQTELEHRQKSQLLVLLNRNLRFSQIKLKRNDRHAPDWINSEMALIAAINDTHDALADYEASLVAVGVRAF